MIPIIADTYRSLKARGLFWVVLWASVAIGLLFASVGCDDSGWHLGFGLFHFQSSYLVAGSVWERSLLLNTLGIIMDYWLTGLAVLLALFPATTVFPDAMQPGTIDLLLSKPISRLKLFLGKYLGAIFFCLVQALIPSLIFFITILLRLGEPHWGILLGAGLVVLVFSFVYCVNVAVGVTSRSSVAALLWTLLFWGALWLVQKTESVTGQETIRQLQVQMGAAGKSMADSMELTHRRMKTTMAFLPKTRATAELFDRHIRTAAPYTFAEIIARSQSSSDDDYARNRGFFTSQRNVENELAKPPLFILGTSLGFEAVILLLAYWRFATRDF